MYIEQKKSGKKTQIYICKKKRVTNKKGKSIPKRQYEVTSNTDLQIS